MKVRYKGGHGAIVWCPGCQSSHMFMVANEQGENPSHGPVWDWDRNTESPTFSPSLLIHGGSGNTVCHSFLRDGVWQFLPDSNHELAGQSVPLPDIPETWFG